MDKDVARLLLELSKSIDPILARMFVEGEKFGDEALRARMKRAVGDLMGFIARDVIFPIENLYPDLRERKESMVPPRAGGSQDPGAPGNA
jgi:hypothetical protein